jgi:starch synthase
VDDGVTGLLVPYDAADPAAFEAGITAAVGELTADPHRAAEMGLAGRERAVTDFGWDALASRTIEIYRAVLAG